MPLWRDRAHPAWHGRHRSAHRRRRLRGPAGADRRSGPRVSGADLFGLIVSALVFVYLCYALLRGERL